MAGSDQVSFKDEDARKMVEDFKTEDQSLAEATIDMVKIAHRETKSPILYHLKAQVIQFASMLAAGALIVFTAGLITDETIEFAFSLKLALVLISFSLFLVSAYEAARLANGQNEIGNRLRLYITREEKR